MTRHTALALLLGTIIGAGILALPYVIIQSGYLLGIILLVLIGIMMTVTMLYLGEITLRTRTIHQLPGYAQKYLGKKGKLLMFFSIAVGIYAAITAYLIGEGESLSYLFFGTIEHQLVISILVWMMMSALVYFGIKAIEKGELLGVSAILLLLLVIAISSVDDVSLQNVALFNAQNFFVPIGVIIFAFMAFTAVPELRRILGREEKLMKRTIIHAHVIALFVYIIFTLVAIGLRGAALPPIATLVLGKPFIILGIFTMFTSYLSLSISLIDSLRFDFNISKNKAWLCTILIPLLLLFLVNMVQSPGFIFALSVGGLLSGGVTAILIFVMIRKAKMFGDRRPEYSLPYSKIIAGIFIGFFILGVLLELLSHIT